MTHGHTHEEAEHAQHHSHSPFDKRVAMTMVAIASLLAAVKVVGHRAHNEAILAQQRASNMWAYYQAKKNRQYNLEMAVKLPLLLNGPAKARAALDGLDLDEALVALVAAKAGGKEDKPKKKKAQDPTNATELLALWTKNIGKWRGDSEAIQEKAEKEEALVKHHHHQADRFDLGELFIELSMVLCSVAILTKRHSFWYGGMLVGLAGTVIAATGFFVH
jgi:hypothetical protein